MTNTYVTIYEIPFSLLLSRKILRWLQQKSPHWTILRERMKKAESYVVREGRRKMEIVPSVPRTAVRWA